MTVDVQVTRERQRRKRLRRIAIMLSPLVAWMWIRIVSGNPVSPGWPHLGSDAMIWLPGIMIILLIGLVLIVPMLGNGKSPETIYLPEQIDVGFDDVKGLGPVLTEVKHTLEVFLNHQHFRDDMGGQPRRGVLFEGPPGTGKTYTAKAMAREAGVPFLFVSSTAFQSMWYGATARKIRSYFRRLRKVAREEGGAIGFIEEFDAIGGKRGGMAGSSGSRIAAATIERSGVAEGVGGVVNELLVQMQSFDDPPRSMKFRNGFIRFVNRFLPSHRHFKTATPSFANILLIGATNRADSLDPALLRPGRFDRVLHFPLPSRSERRELIDYFLSKKSHDETMDDQARDDLAASAMGYSPASLERLFDEALLFAMRDDRHCLGIADCRKARMDVEIGLAEPTEYTVEERESIATHEAGHATVAHLVGVGRKLEVLSIIKRKDALGLLAHSELEERYTKRRSEALAMIQISLGGMVSEELFFGESGTGPGGDLVAATKVAVELVGSLGLGGSLVSFRAADSGAFGGDLVSQVLRDDRARQAVENLLNEQKVVVVRLLSANRHIIEALRDALLERDELVDREITEVIETAQSQAELIVDLREPVR
ncbi:MAG: AAA family ATPase [Acidimicrobiia bacterium]|nr:AAA family ATPase [Acidimicrobiia bacterium]